MEEDEIKHEDLTIKIEAVTNGETTFPEEINEQQLKINNNIKVEIDVKEELIPSVECVGSELQSRKLNFTTCGSDNMNVSNERQVGIKLESGQKGDCEFEIKSHLPGEPFKCSLCSYRACSARKIKKHLRRHALDLWLSCSELYSYEKDYILRLITVVEKDNHCETGILGSHLSIEEINGFQCSLCDFACSTKASFEVHDCRSTGKTNTCDFLATNESDLSSHKSAHASNFQSSKCNSAMPSVVSTVQNAYKCSHCSYSTTVKNHWVNHLSVHTGSKVFTCSKCGYSCGSQSFLITHMAVHKKFDSDEVRSRMRRDLENRKTLKNISSQSTIIESCSDETMKNKDENFLVQKGTIKSSFVDMGKDICLSLPQFAVICPLSETAKFQSENRLLSGHDTLENSLINNEKEQHDSLLDNAVWGTKILQFSCNDENLRVKLESVYPSSCFDYLLKCYFCDVTCNKVSDFVDHLKMHPNKKLFYCDKCPFITSKMYYLANHLRLHIKEKLFKCSVCDYTASNRSLLSIHLRRRHSNKKYTCSICGYYSTSKCKYIRHKRPLSFDKFECDFCGYKTLFKLSHKIHMHRHVGKPVKCSQCDFKSTFGKSFRKHLRTHETEIKKISKFYLISECERNRRRNKKRYAAS